MDGIDGNTHSEINSMFINQVAHDGMIEHGMIELSKKRKLQGYQLDLPLSKHICGDRSSESEQEDQVLYTCMLKEKNNGGIPNYRSEKLESPNGSASLDSGMSLYHAEPEFLKIYSCNQLRNFESEVLRSLTYDQPSTSTGSCGSNSFNTSSQSSDGISTETPSVREEESTFTGRQPSPQARQVGLRFEEDQLPGFGKYADYMCHETGSAEIGQCCSDEEINEMMLYTNEDQPEPPNLFILSSGRWNSDKDIKVDAKKPTIDQEFEQYFSMLMM